VVYEFFKIVVDVVDSLTMGERQFRRRKAGHREMTS
jgi:hypothetical protein